MSPRSNNLFNQLLPKKVKLSSGQEKLDKLRSDLANLDTLCQTTNYLQKLGKKPTSPQD